MESHLNATHDLESFPHDAIGVPPGVSILGEPILARPPPVAAPETPAFSPRSPGLGVLIRLHERIATLDAHMVDLLAREEIIRAERREILAEIAELEGILRMNRALLDEALPDRATRAQMQDDFDRDLVRTHQ